MTEEKDLPEGYINVHLGGVTMQVRENEAHRFLSRGYKLGEAGGLSTAEDDEETIVRREARAKLPGYPEAEIVAAENKAWAEHQKTTKASKRTEARSPSSVPNKPAVSNKSSENK